ncbi:MAG TPA: hypothetical protein P5108_07900 [Marmoricola sp.]|jgi:hypothetical protein|nr:hypothetical protein [Nocardioidaceae bacterium]HRV69359.1 hypothetical protein [Marmoricola sp.]
MNRSQQAELPPVPEGAGLVDLSKAPLPTERTLKRRRSLPLQFTRFVVFNARMLRMVAKGH